MKGALMDKQGPAQHRRLLAGKGHKRRPDVSEPWRGYRGGSKQLRLERWVTARLGRALHVC